MMIRYLYAACTAAALMLPIASPSYAAEFALGFSAVGTVGVANVNHNAAGQVINETAVTAGGAITAAVGASNTGGKTKATGDGSFKSTASASESKGANSSSEG